MRTQRKSEVSKFFHKDSPSQWEYKPNNARLAKPETLGVTLVKDCNVTTRLFLQRLVPSRSVISLLNKKLGYLESVNF